MTRRTYTPCPACGSLLRPGTPCLLCADPELRRVLADKLARVRQAFAEAQRAMGDDQ